MARVVVTARLPGRWAEILAGHQLVAPGPNEAVLSAQRLGGALGEAEALLPLLSLRVDEALLSRAPRLRIVANYAVGYDNVDVAAATRRGIVVTHTPDVLTEATAELTWALILALGRRLSEGEALARGGHWRGWEPDQLVGLELGGATLGVIGLGRIGQAVARRARAFDMRVLYSGRRRAAPTVELGASFCPLDTLLAEADVVSLHLPLGAETRRLIGPRELALMKRSALLINTARGPIVDEAALAEALIAGRLGGAGLDVYEDEPRIHPLLLAAPRTVLLPHLGSATERARAQMAETAAQSIADHLAGRRPRHVVDSDVPR